MGQTPSYPEWLEEVRGFLALSRPDIAASDLDPNASYRAWQRGATSAEFISGDISLKDRPKVADNPAATSLSQDEIDQFLFDARQGRIRASGVDAENGTGSFDVVMTHEGQKITGHATYKGKWVAASCPAE